MSGPALALEEAQARLLALALPLPVEHVDIEGALGRFLALPLHALRTQPSADLSAMDGYAVSAGDMAGPWRVIGESAAGRPFAGTAAPGEAVRISTGAILPSSTDAIILQEDMARDGDIVRLTGEPPFPADKHVRRRGLDFVTGSEVLAVGDRIGAAQAALAIAAGHRYLTVRRRPRVVIIDSGDELAAEGADCAPHQIPASNGVMLKAMAADIPCEVERIGPIADDMAALAAALARAEGADLVVTSGGASVGDHDLVRPALAAWGAELDFWRVAIKPGKPILVARKGSTLIVGLPGNPVSSFVTAYLFLLPVLRAMLGAARALPQPVVARLAAPLRPSGSRREFLRARWDGASVTAQEVQDSGALVPLAVSNALIDRAPRGAALAAGDSVTAYLVENGGLA